MNTPNANKLGFPVKLTRPNSRDTKRRRDDSPAHPSDTSASQVPQPSCRRKRPRRQSEATPDEQHSDGTTGSELSQALQRFIVENAAIEQVLASTTASPARVLQGPWGPLENEVDNGGGSLFPIQVDTDINARHATTLACTALFGSVNKGTRTAKMALLTSSLDSLVSSEPSTTPGYCVMHSKGDANPVLVVSATVFYPRARWAIVESCPALAEWAKELVLKGKSRRLDKLIRTTVLTRPPNPTDANSPFSPWSPLDRLLALKLALQQMQTAKLLVVHAATSTYTLTSASPNEQQTDPLASLDPDSTEIPWIPAAHLSIPMELLTNPHLLDYVLSKLTLHFHSTPRATASPTQPTLSFHEALRVLDKILLRLFPYVPTRSVAARAILSHLEAQRCITFHPSTQVSIISTPSAEVPPPLAPSPTVTSLRPHILALPRCCDTSNPMVQSFTRAVWQTLEQRHARTVPAMIHQLVYFHQDGGGHVAHPAGVAAMTESERWITAEYAVWRAWKELKVVGLKLVDEPSAARKAAMGRDIAAAMEPELEELQAQIAATPIGVGTFDPRKLLLVELVNGPAPKKGPRRRRGGALTDRGAIKREHVYDG